MGWRILVSDGLSLEGMTILQTSAEVIDSPDLEPLGSVDALIVRSRTLITSATISLGRPRLKVIGRAGVGTDNIDLDAARAHGITVVNAPAASTISVAEHTLALMLALSRHISQADAAMKQGEWRKRELKGRELSGKRWGIIGVGRVGTQVARLAAALGTHVMGYDPYLEAEEIQRRGAEAVDLDALLATADLISLHVPLTRETRGMIGAVELGKLKPGALLVCTARGSLVNEAALLAALDQGSLAGAALDVFADEPPGLTRLVKDRRVLCTPHIAAQTLEAQSRAGLDIATEVLAALRGAPLRWQVA